jgi:chromosome segregation ATPase
MRTSIWASMIAATLLTGAGCHKKDDSAKAMDKAATSAAKAQEDIRDQANDVNKQQKDVAKDQDRMAKDMAKDQDKLNKDQADVAKQQGELGAAQSDLAQARERYSVAAKQRLANVDAKIQQLELRSDATARDTAAKLRVRRDEIANRLNAAGGQVQADWDAYKKAIDDTFDKLDKDVDKALK